MGSSKSEEKLAIGVVIAFFAIVLIYFGYNAFNAPPAYSGAMLPPQAAILTLTGVQTQFLDVSDASTGNCDNATLISGTEHVLVTAAAPNNIHPFIISPPPGNPGPLYDVEQFWIDIEKNWLLVNSEGCMHAYPYEGQRIAYSAVFDGEDILPRELKFRFEKGNFAGMPVDGMIAFAEGPLGGSVASDIWHIGLKAPVSPGATYTFIDFDPAMPEDSIVYQDSGSGASRIVPEGFVSPFSCTEFLSMDTGSGGSTVFKSVPLAHPSVQCPQS